MKDLSTYFDYAAATPVDDEVLQAMQPYWQDRFYNPSALYLDARAARRDLEAARATVAKALGARPSEIVFTAGGTESINLAIQGIMHAYPGKRVLVSSIEHHAVLEAVTPFDSTLLPVDGKGFVDVAQLVRLVDDNTVLLSVMLANNEVGTIQSISDILDAVNTVRRDRRSRGIELPLFVHSDGCQAPNTIDVHVSRLGVDLLTLNGGKMYGPKQSGMLYVRAGVGIVPLIRGGGQEWGLRSGTENVAFAVGFAAALERAQLSAKAEAVRLRLLRDRFVDRMEAIGAQLHGPKGKRRLASNVYLTFPGHDNERLLMELDERGFQVAVGSACSASSDEPSHVLRSMGVSDIDAQSSLRISLGRYTTEASIDKLAEVLHKTVAKARAKEVY